jgi:hypothetical protein
MGKVEWQPMKSDEAMDPIDGKIAAAVRERLGASVEGVMFLGVGWIVMWFRQKDDMNEYGVHRAEELSSGKIDLNSGDYFPALHRAGKDAHFSARRAARASFAYRAGFTEEAS